MFIVITDQDIIDDNYSYSWNIDILTIVHNLNGRVLTALYDAFNTQSSFITYLY